jgi:hypothetical protein
VGENWHTKNDESFQPEAGPINPDPRRQSNQNKCQGIAIGAKIRADSNQLPESQQQNDINNAYNSPPGGVEEHTQNDGY